MADVRNIVEAQLEQVHPKLIEMTEDFDGIAAKFKKGSKNITGMNRWLYRWPVLQYRGGHFHKVSPNGGAYQPGSSMKIQSLQAGYIYTAMTYRLSDEEIDTSKNTKQSVVNVLSKTLAEAIIEHQCTMDIEVHGDGTGKLTNSSSAVTTSGSNYTMTFADASDTLGIRKLRVGMAVTVWDSTGATKRAANVNPLVIELIDESTKTITFSGTVTSLVAGDLLSFSNLDAYGPSTLVTGSAGWPATSAKTTQLGLTGDSFRHGIYYAHNSDSSSYYCGKQRSALPTLIPTYVNGSGQSMTFMHMLLIQDKIRQKRGEDQVGGLEGIFPMAQRAQIVEIGTTIVNKNITGNEVGDTVDMGMKNVSLTSTFDMFGTKCHISKRQPNDRIDFVNFKNWGKAEASAYEPIKVGGNTTWEVREQSTGYPMTLTEFGWKHGNDYVCFDPGAEAYIDGLDVPSGY